MSTEELQKLCRLNDIEELKNVLEDLKIDYNNRDSSLMIINEGNLWKIIAREKYIPVIKKVVTETELSKSIMETLAVIAWKYPIKQSDLIRVRTNKAYDHLSQLEEMGYITRQKYGRTKLIKLADKFFSYFDLPQDKLKERFSDFSQIADAIKQKEEDIEQLKQEHKEQIKEAKKLQEEQEQQQKEEIQKQEQEVTDLEQEKKEQPVTEEQQGETVQENPVEKEQSQEQQTEEPEQTQETQEEPQQAEENPVQESNNQEIENKDDNIPSQMP